MAGMPSGIVRRLTDWLVPIAMGLIGKRLPLPKAKAEKIEETLNQLGPDKVRKMHVLGTLAALPIMAAIAAPLILPFAIPERILFSGWDNVVFSMPNWNWIFAVLPIILLSGGCANWLSIKAVRLWHHAKWPDQSSSYLDYLGEAVVLRKDGYKVLADYVFSAAHCPDDRAALLPGLRRAVLHHFRYRDQDPVPQAVFTAAPKPDGRSSRLRLYLHHRRRSPGRSAFDLARRQDAILKPLPWCGQQDRRNKCRAIALKHQGRHFG